MIKFLIVEKLKALFKVDSIEVLEDLQGRLDAAIRLSKEHPELAGAVAPHGRQVREAGTSLDKGGKYLATAYYQDQIAMNTGIINSPEMARSLWGDKADEKIATAGERVEEARYMLTLLEGS